MKHATDATLDEIDALLVQIRSRQQLTERKRGIFCLRSKSFVHFHDDPGGVFADLSSGASFERFRVVTAEERAAFLKALDGALG